MYSSQDFGGEKIKETLLVIFPGYPPSRINEMVKVFHKKGCHMKEDLKYFDKQELNDLKSLEDIEILKITTFIHKNYPEEYEEHKRNRAEMSKLKHEIERINKATEFEEQKSDLHKEEFRIRQQFNDRKEILDDISKLTEEYMTLNKKKFTDYIKDKKVIQGIRDFTKRKDVSKKLLQEIKLKNVELDEKEPKLQTFLKE